MRLEKGFLNKKSGETKNPLDDFVWMTEKE